MATSLTKNQKWVKRGQADNAERKWKDEDIITAYNHGILNTVTNYNPQDGITTHLLFTAKEYLTSLNKQDKMQKKSIGE